MKLQLVACEVATKISPLQHHLHLSDFASLVSTRFWFDPVFTWNYSKERKKGGKKEKEAKILPSTSFFFLTMWCGTHLNEWGDKKSNSGQKRAWREQLYRAGKRGKYVKKKNYRPSNYLNLVMVGDWGSFTFFVTWCNMFYIIQIVELKILQLNCIKYLNNHLFLKFF